MVVFARWTRVSSVRGLWVTAGALLSPRRFVASVSKSLAAFETMDARALMRDKGRAVVDVKALKEVSFR